MAEYAVACLTCRPSKSKAASYLYSFCEQVSKKSSSIQIRAALVVGLKDIVPIGRLIEQALSVPKQIRQIEHREEQGKIR